MAGYAFHQGKRAEMAIKIAKIHIDA